MTNSWITAVMLTASLTLSAQRVVTLEECRSLALENNKKIRIAREKVAVERNNRSAAFSKYFPEISFAGTYQRTEKELSLLHEDAKLPVLSFDPTQGKYVPSVVTDAMGRPINGQGQPTANPSEMIFKQIALIPKEAFAMDTRNLFAGGFSLIQPIYMGGKIRAYNQITRYAEEIARLSLDNQSEELILIVDEAYWQIVSLSHKEQLADGYVALLERLSENVATMIKCGVATESDRLSIEVKLNESRMTQLKVKDGLSLGKMLLATQCGLPIDESITLPEEQNLPTATLTTSKPDIEYALSNRTELKLLEAGEKIYRKKQTVALSESLPNIGLTAGYLWTNPNLYNGFQNEFSGMWSVGLSVKIPLSFWEHTYKVRAAKGETRMAQYKLDDAREQIALQVNQSSFKMNEANKRLLLSQTNLEKAKENLRQAEMGYKAGVTTTTNILEAQTAWLMANDEYISAAIDLQLSQTYLSKALGKSIR